MYIYMHGSLQRYLPNKSTTIILCDYTYLTKATLRQNKNCIYSNQ